MAKNKRYMAVHFGIDSGVAMTGSFDGGKLELEPMHRFRTRFTAMLDAFFWDFPGMLIHAKAGLAAFACRHGGHLDGVACSSWGSDFGLLDKNGHLLANPVHHLDKRTEGIVERLAAVFPERSLYQRTGIRSTRGHTLSQLHAMSQANSPLLDKAVTMLLMADLVSYFLTGIPVQEYTLASTTGMYGIESRDWSRDIILGAKIPPGMVPEVVAPGTVIGPLLDSVMAECGLSGTPVIAPASRAVAGAMAAAPGEGDDWICITSGYWNQVGVELANPLLNDATFTARFGNFGGVDGSIAFQRDSYGFGLIDDSLALWAREDGRGTSLAEVLAAAEAVPALQRIVNPDSVRLICAADKIAAVNAILRENGQPEAATRAEAVRAHLDGMILSLRDGVSRLSELTGRKYGAINLVGRAVSYPFLAQALADATGMRVLAGPAEAKAVGNVIMQMIALGDLGSLAEARDLIRSSFTVTEYTPGKGEAWREAAAVFERLQEKGS